MNRIKRLIVLSALSTCTLISCGTNQVANDNNASFISSADEEAKSEQYDNATIVECINKYYVDYYKEIEIRGGEENAF